MTTTKTKPTLDIVREVIDIIEQCEADGMAMLTSMEVEIYLKDNYGYSKGDALTLLEGVHLIQELGLMWLT